MLDVAAILAELRLRRSQLDNAIETLERVQQNELESSDKPEPKAKVAKAEVQEEEPQKYHPSRANIRKMHEGRDRWFRKQRRLKNQKMKAKNEQLAEKQARKRSGPRFVNVHVRRISGIRPTMAQRHDVGSNGG